MDKIIILCLTLILILKGRVKTAFLILFICHKYCQVKYKVPIHYLTYGQSVFLIIIDMENHMVTVKLKLNYNTDVTNIAKAIIIISHVSYYKFY